MSRDINRNASKKVSQSAFSHLFCQLLRQSQKGISNITELETRLARIGFQIGCKQLELVRNRLTKSRDSRDVTRLAIMEFISKHVWMNLFGKQSDGLERSVSKENEFFIVDLSPVTNIYVSVPESIKNFNAAAFIAGIIHGILDSAGFIRPAVPAPGGRGELRRGAGQPAPPRARARAAQPGPAAPLQPAEGMCCSFSHNHACSEWPRATATATTRAAAQVVTRATARHSRREGCIHSARLHR